MAHACNYRILEAEAGKSLSLRPDCSIVRVPEQIGLYRETLPQNTKLFLVPPTLPLLSPNFMSYFFLNNLPVLMCVVHILMGMEPSTCIWLAYQDPYH